MTPDQMLTLANASVIPFWLLLVVAPRWRFTQLAVHAVLMPVLLGAAYLWLVATGAFTGPGVPEGASFMSLQGLQLLFTYPPAVVAGWIHYLVFDLFVGAWEARDAQRRGVPHWALVPCLVLTFLLGPIGLLLYLGVRVALGKGGWSLREEDTA